MLEMILIVDDEASQRHMMEYAIRQKLGYHAVMAANGEDALRRVRSGGELPHLMLVDLELPDCEGIRIIREVKAVSPQMPVIALTPHGDEAYAVQAMRAGANDFLAKPVMLERLKLSIQQALKIRRMSSHIARLERGMSGHVDFSDIVGRSPALKDALALARYAASSRLPVWIEGKYGTGKELLARAIHGGSDRAGKPFVTVHCASLPAEGAEAMLFGQETLAGEVHFILGKLREADQGTLLLKEIDALPQALQRRLFETLGEGRITPLGASASIALDVRVLCTASGDCGAKLRQGMFYSGLYERLRGLCIALPPLCERREDIPALAKHFVRLYAASENKSIYGLTEDALAYLAEASWPGNVRQLAHLLWRSVLLCNQDLLDNADIRLIQQLQPVHYNIRQESMAGAPSLLDTQGRIRKLKLIEEEVIRFALSHSGGCMTRAARSLGIGRSTLYRRVSLLGMKDQISRANHTMRPTMKVSSIERS